MPNKTTHLKASQINRQWHIVDASNQVLGRMATSVAYILIGKGKRTYSPHVDGGDFVVIINAKKVRIKGNNKPIQKINFRHSGFPGGDTMIPFGEFLKSNPEKAVTFSIRGMLPKNKLRPRMLKRLRVFAGENHPHKAHFIKKADKAESKKEKSEIK